ncbi:hypothetical protein CFE53_05230 [Methanofervidicoccus sp. A16]|uniref:V4R domain-containing protein n=1 Tax=Methanofervidicoccus sp. A16 TaxID=2607662 RepID=UPI00118BCB3C|nr:V4R domain-containing protein [Methanofervidicoccus sp. A16]AXI25558.1 hypothetical protein CFE53_05230 [Methanofervidicoccus sp. A16]
MPDFSIINLFKINAPKEKGKLQNAKNKLSSKLPVNFPVNFEDIGEVNRRTLGRCIDIVAYRAVHLSIVKYLGFNALSKLYNAGADFGKSLGVKSIEEMMECFEYLGMGIPKLVSEDPIKIRVYECAFCSGLPNVGKSVCYFERGIIKGCLEEILNKKIKVVESKCYANGHDYCEFVAYSR